MHTFAVELRQAWRSLLARKACFVTCVAILTLVGLAELALGATIEQARDAP